MAKAEEFPLNITIRAIDKATGPLQAIDRRIQANLKGLEKAMKPFSNLGKGFAGVGSALGKVGSEAVALGAKLVGIGVAAGYGLYHVVRGAVDAGDKLNEMSKRVGLSVDQFAQLQFAAAQSDIEIDEFAAGIDKFNVALGQLKATGKGPLKEFGPAFAAQLKGAKGTAEALDLMVKAAGKLKDSPEKLAAFGKVGFGKGGKQFGQFLSRGSKEIDELKRRYFELAGSQEEFAKQSDLLDNALRETEMAFEGAKNAAVTALMPAILELTTAFTKFLGDNRPAIQQFGKDVGEALSAWLKGGGPTRLAEGLRSFGSALSSVFTMIGGFKGVMVGVGLWLGAPLLGALTALVPAFASLAVAVAPFAIAAAPFIALAGAIAFLGKTVRDNWGDLKLLFGDAESRNATVVTALKGFFDPNAELREKAAHLDAVKGMQARQAFDTVGTVNKSLQQSKVSVDFNNMPKGTRVSQEKSPNPIDLNLGYAMGVP